MMNSFSQQFCQHTYCRWDGKTAVCAVCGVRFLEIVYNADLKGTFPRELATLRPKAVATTCLAQPTIDWRIL